MNENERLIFINKGKQILNVGDVLCSPRYYYKFHLGVNNPPVAIIGGGAFNDLGLGDAKRLSKYKTVLWAVGRSAGFSERVIRPRTWVRRHFEEIMAATQHSLASVRDLEWARHGIQFVPCPSVHHPLVDLPSGESVGVFLNKNYQTSGENVENILRDIVEKDAAVLVGTNGVSLDNFKQGFSRAGRIITNSYHVAYWSLLSGRSIQLIGYSTKFSSLLRLFNIKNDSLFRSVKGDAVGLSVAVSLAMESDGWINVKDHDEYKARFRGINDEFASLLVERGVFESIKNKKCKWSDFPPKGSVS